MRRRLLEALASNRLGARPRVLRTRHRATAPFCAWARRHQRLLITPFGRRQQRCHGGNRAVSSPSGCGHAAVAPPVSVRSARSSRVACD